MSASILRGELALSEDAGTWLLELRESVGLSRTELAHLLELANGNVILGVEKGSERVPSHLMCAWAKAVGQHPSESARRLLKFYDREFYRLLFELEN
jgi:hypothetical protein